MSATRDIVTTTRRIADAIRATPGVAIVGWQYHYTESSFCILNLYLYFHLYFVGRQYFASNSVCEMHFSSEFFSYFVDYRNNLSGCPDVSVVAFDSPEFNIYAINDGMKVGGDATESFKLFWIHLDFVIVLSISNVMVCGWQKITGARLGVEFSPAKISMGK